MARKGEATVRDRRIIGVGGLVALTGVLLLSGSAWAAGAGAAQAQSCAPLVGATLGPFAQHLKFAHLERSLEDQVRDAQDVDQYVKTHTVLVETMAAPAMGALGGCGAAPVPQVPGPAPAPAPPMPGHMPGPAPAGAVGVMVMGNAFAPGSVQVEPGGTVTWTNMDAVPHTVTGGALQSSALGQGGVFTHTFDSPGAYAYYCAIHPDMKGAVVVGG
ncbi:MAG: cupredoxin domain-containing protein [Actinomycetota bacterium]